MSAFSWIMLIVLAVLFGLLIVLFVRQQRKRETLLKNPLHVTGTVKQCSRVRSGGAIYQRVTVCYSVDGREFKHVFLCRPDQYSTDQTVALFCQPDKPQTAFRQADLMRSRPQRERWIVVILIAAMYAVVVVAILSNEIPFLKPILKNAEFPLVILYSIGIYANERRILKRGIPCTGTIVFSERDHKTVRVMAEYTVDGIPYETRQMQIPAKRCTREYCVGGQIDVLYKKNSPGEGAIREDAERMEKLRRIAPIVGIAVLLPIWIILMVVFG